jgi:hypothetical protein
VIHLDFEVNGSRTILSLPHELPALDVYADEQPTDHADKRTNYPREQETHIGHGAG